MLSQVAVATSAEAAGNLREVHFVHIDPNMCEAFVLAAVGICGKTTPRKCDQREQQEQLSTVVS